MSGSKRKCHWREYWCPKRLEFNNQCGVVSRKLIDLADLTRAQFVVLMKRRFSEKLVRMGACVARRELCFIAFPIVPFNWEPVSTFGFLEGNFLTVSSSSPSPSPTSASSAMSTDADEFLADLVVELVLLPTSVSSALSHGVFLADWVRVVLSLEVSGLANWLKPWMKRQ